MLGDIAWVWIVWSLGDNRLLEESSSCACDEVGVLTTLGWWEVFTCKNEGTEGSVELLFVNRFKVLLKI